MSGISATLHSTTYDDGSVVEHPAIDANDRAYALACVYWSGFHRGFSDGKTLMERHSNAVANAVPAGHLKLHAEAALKAIAPTLTDTNLSAATLRDRWLEGYEAGLPMAYGLGSAAF